MSFLDRLNGRVAHVQHIQITDPLTDSLPPFSASNPMIRRRRPEVLAPAGNLNTVKAVIDAGADAVYCAGKMFGMRSAPKNLTMEELSQAVDYAHARSTRIFITCNVLPTNPEVEGIQNYVGTLNDMGVDAVIVSDIGLLMIAHKTAPQLELHVSTQAGVVNYLTANAMYELGARRVVLARELSLDAVREIRENTPPDLDIECFVHGSMCMAFSGRCLISNYLTGRDANHGDCAQPCRWKYSVVEEKRPGEYFPVGESNEGTYLFNSQDMNMLEHIDDLLDAGATSLKIEGRGKSALYASTITNAYKMAASVYVERRQAGDKGPIDLPQWLKEEPFKVTHRPYSTGFYYPDHQVTQSTDRGGYLNEWRIVGNVLSWQDGRLTFRARNLIQPGDTVEFIQTGRQPYRLIIDNDIRDEDGKRVEASNRPMYIYSIPCPQAFDQGIPMRAQVRKAKKV